MHPLEQYVWDIRYVDAPVVRFYDGNTDGDLTGGAAEGDSVLYYTTDSNFSVTALVDAASGAVVERYAYTPYGAASVLSGARDDEGTATTEWQSRAATLFDNQVLYSGYRLDSVTGLYHTDAREYDAYLGRFVQVDPMGLAAGPNVYAYCDGWPTGATDPTGLAPDWDKISQGIFSVCEGASEILIGLPTGGTGPANIPMLGKGVADYALGLNKIAEGFRGVEGAGTGANLAEVFADGMGKLTGASTEEVRARAGALDFAMTGMAGAYPGSGSRNLGSNSYRINAPRVGLSEAELARIQAFANKYGEEVTVVGSRAGGTAGPASDFDYIIGGNSKIRAAARRELPRGRAGGEIHPTRGETGIDVFNGNNTPLDPTRPHVIVKPKQGT